MKNKKIHILIMLSLVMILLSCQKQNDSRDDGDTVSMSGIMTRSSGNSLPSINYGVYISAKLDGQPYMTDVPSTMAANTGVITFNNGAVWYYPLNRKNLAIYAFTNAAVNDVMTLTSGQAVTNDALLSNNGGVGTPGSANSPVTQLLFSHLMTKVDVLVQVTDPKLESWRPTNFRFNMNGVAATGSYSIYAAAGAPATGVSGAYNIALGTNYLVPTGTTLSNKLTGLVIDNYTATAADLANFTIIPIAPATNIVLKPGQAYTVIFTINSLGLQSVSVQLGNWQTFYISNSAVSYVPQTFTINSGAYITNDITEIEIVDALDDVYAGIISGNTASFVLAPTNADTVRLYTANGLLLSTTGSSLSGGVLDLSKMNRYGMLPVNPSVAYDAVSNPYSVSTVEQFKKINALTSYTYRQTSDLDFNMVSMPSVNMTGSYDGNGFQINNVNISGDGLFTQVSAGQAVQNVWVASGVVTQSGADNYVGGICGTNYGIIAGCINGTRVICSLAKSVGGICGENNGQIIACTNLGNIRGLYGANSYIGGICGNNKYVGGNAITSALNVGMVRATGTPQNGCIAGICGNSVSGGQFSTCYWLSGTAASTIGGSEVAVNGTGLTMNDLANLSPQLIRDPVNPVIVNNLNAALPSPWNVYVFTLSNSAWPLPKK